MTKHTSYFAAIALLATCLAGNLSSARADEAIPTPALTVEQPMPTDDEDKWKFSSPLIIFWLAGVDGDVSGPRLGKVDVDLSPGDVMDNTEIGIVAYLDVSKGRFGIYALPTFLRMESDAKHPAGKATADTDMWIAEFGAHYAFWKWDGDKPGDLAFVAGGRYWSLHNELSVRPTVGPKLSATDSRDLFDPLIGLRYRHRFTEKFHVWVQGDVGGFDISENQSRFSWQVLPLLGYDFNMPLINKPSTVFAGYRVVALEHEENGPPNKTGSNLKFHGAIIGLNVEFF